ncbi:MAG: hypothetical protein ACRC6B_04540, partial [Fusobacteriaceae bacterium]
IALVGNENSYLAGANIYDGSTFENSVTGKIEIEGDSVTGIEASNSSEVVNEGNIKLAGSGSGINAWNSSKVVNKGNISLTGEGYAIRAWDSSIAKNEGNIYGETLAETFIVGMEANHGSSIENNGIINLTGSGIGFGMEVSENSKGINNGLIIVEGKRVEGARTFGGTFINSETGTIEVKATEGSAIGIIGYREKSIIENYGIINIDGNNSYRMSYGMYVIGNDSIATNNGTINIDGKGSYGMYALQSSTIVNGLEGTINVGASAAGGMYADSDSTAINYGTINIDETNEGGETIAMVGPGTLINAGAITSDTDLVFDTTSGGNYVIGTSENGTYGKISAKSVSLDGDIKVSANMTKNGFKDNY